MGKQAEEGPFDDLQRLGGSELLGPPVLGEDPRLIVEVKLGMRLFIDSKRPVDILFPRGIASPFDEAEHPPRHIT